MAGHGHLISAHKGHERKRLCSEHPSPVLCGSAQSTEGVAILYLRGLSLNRVLWLPITELPPLLLLPSSSPWE